MNIVAANRECLRRIQAGTAVLVGLRLAGEIVPDLSDHVILHAGPPS